MYFKIIYTGDTGYVDLIDGQPDSSWTLYDCETNPLQPASVPTGITQFKIILDIGSVILPEDCRYLFARKNELIHSSTDFKVTEIQTLHNFITTNVQNFAHAFDGVEDVSQIDLTSWSVFNCKDFSCMFKDSKFKSIKCNSWTMRTENCSSMFENCDASNKFVIDSLMFENPSSNPSDFVLTPEDYIPSDIVITCSRMFYNSNFEDIHINNFDVDNCADFSEMFSNLRNSKLSVLDLENMYFPKKFLPMKGEFERVWEGGPYVFSKYSRYYSTVSLFLDQGEWAPVKPNPSIYVQPRYYILKEESVTAPRIKTYKLSDYLPGCRAAVWTSPYYEYNSLSLPDLAYIYYSSYEYEDDNNDYGGFFRLFPQVEITSVHEELEQGDIYNHGIYDEWGPAQGGRVYVDRDETTPYRGTAVPDYNTPYDRHASFWPPVEEKSGFSAKIIKPLYVPSFVIPKGTELLIREGYEQYLYDIESNVEKAREMFTFDLDEVNGSPWWDSVRNIWHSYPRHTTLVRLTQDIKTPEFFISESNKKYFNKCLYVPCGAFLPAHTVGKKVSGVEYDEFSFSYLSPDNGRLARVVDTILEPQLMLRTVDDSNHIAYIPLSYELPSNFWDIKHHRYGAHDIFDAAFPVSYSGFTLQEGTESIPINFTKFASHNQYLRQLHLENFFCDEFRLGHSIPEESEVYPLTNLTEFVSYDPGLAWLFSTIGKKVEPSNSIYYHSPDRHNMKDFGLESRQLLCDMGLYGFGNPMWEHLHWSMNGRLECAYEPGYSFEQYQLRTFTSPEQSAYDVMPPPIFSVSHDLYFKRYELKETGLHETYTTYQFDDEFRDLANLVFFGGAMMESAVDDTFWPWSFKEYGHTPIMIVPSRIHPYGSPQTTTWQWTLETYLGNALQQSSEYENLIILFGNEKLDDTWELWTPESYKTYSKALMLNIRAGTKMPFDITNLFRDCKPACFVGLTSVLFCYTSIFDDFINNSDVRFSAEVSKWMSDQWCWFYGSTSRQSFKNLQLSHSSGAQGPAMDLLRGNSYDIRPQDLMTLTWNNRNPVSLPIVSTRYTKRLQVLVKVYIKKEDEDGVERWHEVPKMWRKMEQEYGSPTWVEGQPAVKIGDDESSQWTKKEDDVYVWGM